MRTVDFYNTVDISDDWLQSATIVAGHNDKWFFCRHKDRDACEIPDGHREVNENIIGTVGGELFEETGAVTFEPGEIEPKYNYIFFDADNTLFDFDRAEAKALESTFIKFGHRYGSEVHSKYRRISKGLWDDFEIGKISILDLQKDRFKLLLDEIGIDEDPMNFNLQYLNELADCAQLFDGAEEVCRALSEYHKLVIVTNGISMTQHKRFEASGIKKYFTGLFVSGDIGFQKPQVEFFDFVFKSLGITDKNQVLIVGDSLSSDVKGGNDAEIHTCWFNPKGMENDKGVKVDIEIRNLTELKEIII